METQEQEQYGTNVNETNNSNSGNEIIENIEIEGTPFKTVVTENGTFIALGGYRLTELQRGHETAQIAEALGEGRIYDWNLMVAIIGAITNTTLATYLNEINEMLNRKNEKNVNN